MNARLLTTTKKNTRGKRHLKTNVKTQRKFAEDFLILKILFTPTSVSQEFTTSLEYIKKESQRKSDTHRRPSKHNETPYNSPLSSKVCSRRHRLLRNSLFWTTQTHSRGKQNTISEKRRSRHNEISSSFRLVVSSCLRLFVSSSLPQKQQPQKQQPKEDREKERKKYWLYIYKTSLVVEQYFGV